MVTNKLLKLARAMVEFEGWNYPQEKAGENKIGSVSWQNHNPGNLKRSPWAVGVSGGFAIFINDEIGFSALVWDLHQKAIGNTATGLSGQSTIYDLVKVYSGEGPDIVANYSRFIEQRTGLLMTIKLEELVR